jgi:hypothetical protein
MTIEQNLIDHILTIHQAITSGSYCNVLAWLTANRQQHRHQLMTHETLPFTSATLYRSVVGALLYASQATRPDINETVNRLCSFMPKPIFAHMENAKTCLMYLQRTATRGITFLGGSFFLRQMLGGLGYKEQDATPIGE